MGERIRIQKAISAAGLMSRRKAEGFIRAGRITVEGRVAVLGDRVDPDTECLEIDGVPVPVAPGLVTYLLYKPVDVITTTDDPHGRPTVLDLVPSDPRVWPVGRLDADSEGLLLLTNDGELTNRVTHPRYLVTKTYMVLLKGRVGSSVISRLCQGVELDDGPARALEAKVVDTSSAGTLVEMVMGEGRNREIRRMADAVGHRVLRLVRTAIGPIVDRTLRGGQWRLLTNEEVATLYRIAEENG